MKLVLIFALLILPMEASAQKQKHWDIGIVSDLEKDSLLHASGYNYLIESVGKIMSPKKISDDQFTVLLQKIKRARINLYAVNIFIPGELKVVGPDVDESKIINYVEIVFKRCQQAGVQRVIWGSGGSRRIPEGFDHAKARQQFVDVARKVAAVAKSYNITLALENLNSTETNFITTLKEASSIVEAVNHPNFKLSVDIYHMLKEGEDASVITSVGKNLVHCEVAEKEGRAAPGTSGQDFTPYLKALKASGYKGKIFVECNWKDIRSQAGAAGQYLRLQIESVL